MDTEDAPKRIDMEEFKKERYVEEVKYRKLARRSIDEGRMVLK